METLQRSRLCIFRNRAGEGERQFKAHSAGLVGRTKGGGVKPQLGFKSHASVVELLLENIGNTLDSPFT